MSTPGHIHSTVDTPKSGQHRDGAMQQKCFIQERPVTRIHCSAIVLFIEQLPSTHSAVAVYWSPAWQIRQWPLLVWPLLFLLENFLGMQTMMMTVQSRAGQSSAVGVQRRIISNPSGVQMYGSSCCHNHYNVN